MEAAELARRPGRRMVEIKAAGVCHSDLHPALGDGRETPLVLGHEGAGIVREVGPSVTHLRRGDHVVLCWAPACGVCPPCREGRAVLCDRVEKVSFRNKLPSGAARLHARGQDVAPFLGTPCFPDFVVVLKPARFRGRPTSVRRAGESRSVRDGVGAVTCGPRAQGARRRVQSSPRRRRTSCSAATRAASDHRHRSAPVPLGIAERLAPRDIEASRDVPVEVPG